MTEKKMRVAVFVSGRGSNLRALLDAQAGGRLSRVEFVLVFADKIDPLAFNHAREFGIDTASLKPKAFGSKSEYESALLELLKAADVEFIVLAGYMRIVGETLLGAYPNRMINIHPSLLPAFPGLESQRQALEYGAKVSGCTVHFVDSGVDSGPIILQETVAVLPDDDDSALSARILAEEHRALPEVLEAISEQRVEVEGRRVTIRAKK